MVLGITLFPAKTVKFNNRTLNNTTAIYGLFGIILVGLGMYIGGGESLHAYFYITVIIQLIILGLFVLTYHLFKKVGYSKLINICSLCLVTISYLMYIYYIIASFIYY